MPRLSDSMEEGTIVKWLKADGDSVARGDEIAEIETDKATMTYEADADGVLPIVASEGDTLPVGEVIARLNGEGGGGAASDAAETSGGEDRESGGEEDEEASESEDEPEAEEAEDEAAEEESEPAKQPVAEESEEESAPSAPPSEGNGGERVKASPIARRMAREKGLELSALSGSGPGGRIVKADVEAAESGDGAKGPRKEGRGGGGA